MKAKIHQILDLMIKWLEQKIKLAKEKRKSVAYKNHEVVYKEACVVAVTNLDKVMHTMLKETLKEYLNYSGKQLTHYHHEAASDIQQLFATTVAKYFDRE